MTAIENDSVISVAQARITRHEELVAQLEMQRMDTTDAKSQLSALRYSLKVLKRHRRRAQRKPLRGWRTRIMLWK